MTFHLVDTADQVLSVALEERTFRSTLIPEGLVESHN